MKNIKEIVILVDGENVVDIEYREELGGEGFVRQEYFEGSPTERFLTLLEHHLVNAYKASIEDFKNQNTGMIDGKV